MGITHRGSILGKEEDVAPVNLGQSAHLFQNFFYLQIQRYSIFTQQRNGSTVEDFFYIFSMFNFTSYLLQ